MHVEEQGLIRWTISPKNGLVFERCWIEIVEKIENRR